MTSTDALGAEPREDASAPGETLSRTPRSSSPWFGFALRRTAALIATFVAVLIVTFLIVPLIPGDPAISAAGADATPERIEQLRIELGLDRPIGVQFLDYVAGVFRGDLGQSFSLSASVADIVRTRLPFTTVLALLSIVLVLLIAVPVGMMVGALTRNGRRRWLDIVFGLATGLVSSIPPYVLATLLVLVFAVGLSVLPPAYSRSSPGLAIVLPVLALSLGPMSLIARVVRRETAAVLEQDYIRTARGWRIGAVPLYLRYALPNLLTSTLTLSGLILTSMLGGAIIIETVFAWPGLGTAVVEAIIARDYPLIQGIVLVLSMLAAVLVILVDVVLALIDPRTLGADHD